MSGCKIQFTGLVRQYQNLRSELIDINDRVYASGVMVDGVYTAQFEEAIAARTDRKYAIAVNSCSQALIMGISTFRILYDIKHILVPAVSAAATVNSVLMTGATPVFIDVDKNALMDLALLDQEPDGAFQMIMYVNLFGNILDYDKLQVLNKFFRGVNVPIIEDAAHSFGASYKGIPSGKLGDVSCLSFDHTKSLPNYGTGGMLLTDDAILAGIFLDLRNNGYSSQHAQAGTNCKMSEADCAQMLVKLRHFDAWQDRRTAIAKYYSEQLHDLVVVPKANDDVVHAWHAYVIYVEDAVSCDATALMQTLSHYGVETKQYYKEPLTNLDVSFDHIQFSKKSFNAATNHCYTCVGLPIYPEMTDTEVEYVVDRIKHYFRMHGRHC